MFRHQGKNRTLQHNLGIASLLSFVAGMVNVAGFLSVQRLTTNVTGHFAFFVDEVFRLEFLAGLVYFLYIFFFFLGSFTSGFLVEVITRRNANYIYVIPTLLEAFILTGLAFSGAYLAEVSRDLVACCLLFAMGLQNSLVTAISSSTVRTTHLTGLFTDLGIELSQLFFFRKHEEKEKLKSSVRLRLTIICFFFLGGIAGGVGYTWLRMHVLACCGLLLVAGLYYDNILIRLKHKAEGLQGRSGQSGSGA